MFVGDKSLLSICYFNLTSIHHLEGVPSDMEKLGRADDAETLSSKLGRGVLERLGEANSHQPENQQDERRYGEN